jgi:hypothetical protein
MSLPRPPTPLLALLVAVLLSGPVAAQDFFAPSTPKTEPSATELLQTILLGKLKDQQPKPPTAAGSSSTTTTTTGKGSVTSSSTGSVSRLPRKTPGTGTANSAPPDAPADAPPAKPARPLRPPQREADFHPLPRLKPTPPISASPTIQLPQPIPMPVTPVQ